MTASPAMARQIENSDDGTITIRRAHLLWAGTVLLNLLGMVYGYGRLTERVDNQRDQLNRIELRLNELSGHK